tara:strand:- start:258 stop:647 length:390 start_codon:yes stop_codon:yes gene_type:complete
MDEKLITIEYDINCGNNPPAKLIKGQYKLFNYYVLHEDRKFTPREWEISGGKSKNKCWQRSIRTLDNTKIGDVINKKTYSIINDYIKCKDLNYNNDPIEDTVATLEPKFSKCVFFKMQFKSLFGCQSKM